MHFRKPLRGLSPLKRYTPSSCLGILSKKKTNMDEVNPPVPTGSEKKYKVLIIDDDKFLLDMYSMKFSEKEFMVEVAFGSMEALEKLKGGNHPDIILLDIVMPTMDGFELLQEIKNQNLAPEAVISKYVGGSIPILGDFQKILGSKVISVSLGNDDCHMHGVDENFKVDLIEKGLKFAENFWKK
jgi:CheY-like chemotaxis protein